MEIAPVPRPRGMSARARALALVVVFGPVILLALVPALFDLHRTVATSASASTGIERGSVLFHKTVPVSEVRAGDLITYQPPAAYGVDGPVTHRVTRVRPHYLVTEGDSGQRPDPWVVRPDRPTLSRVEFAVPWVGYPFLAPVGRSAWLALLLVPSTAVGLVLAGDASRRRRTASVA